MTATSVLEVPALKRWGAQSPLRYPGGKAALAGLFADLIERLGIDTPVYVEPYAGGAGAGVALLRQGLVSRLVINDIDPAVHAFWESAVHGNADFIDRVIDVPLDVEEWRRQRDIYRAKAAPPMDLGFAFFYLNRTNRSGVLNAGVIGGLEQAGAYKIDARFNRDTLVKRLKPLGELADRIDITDKDGRTVIREYADNPSAFMYVDPPYVVAGSRLYLNAFERRDHEALAKMLSETTESHWLLTYDVAPLIEHLYSEYFQCRLALNYSARHPGKAQELLVATPAVAAALQTLFPSSGVEEMT